MGAIGGQNSGRTDGLGPAYSFVVINVMARYPTEKGIVLARGMR